MSRIINREITQLEPENGFLVINRLKKKFDFPIHFHPEYELNFIQNGKGVRRVVGNSIEELDEIELVLVGPYVVHGWETHNCKSDSIYEMTIQFNNNIFDYKLLSLRMFKSIRDMLERSKHGILFSKKTSLEIMPRIKEFSKIETIEEFIKLLEILQELANSKEQRLLSTTLSNKNEYEQSRRIKIVYEFVQENYNRKITLPEISEIVNMTPVSFNRFIKKRTGKTFIDYVNHTRLSNATKLLIETDLNIGEIGFKSGFNNIANFNRIFKKIKNCTPNEYRMRFENIN
ncbi:AraC-like DNA-binding protein [Lutibacter oceani]|uniref:AraC-like DNA-binding protein n=1 Tax=Lutibacter oceani TaxID=1853311 RepID=A0A3D9RQ98_9FLAO|nr:AraC family transcriptional regulator [Lutibacter oceani]REE82099.1 AraC-like DNA-binding protein [Lutibacter oceani]